MIQGWRRWPAVIPKQMFLFMLLNGGCNENLPAQRISKYTWFVVSNMNSSLWDDDPQWRALIFRGLNFTHQPVEVWSNVFLGFLFVVSRFWYPDLDIFKYIFWSKTGDIEGNIQEAQKGKTEKNLWLSGWFQSHSCFMSRVLPFCGGFCLVTSKTTMVSVKQKVLIADTWAVFKCSKTLLVDD